MRALATCAAILLVAGCGRMDAPGVRPGDSVFDFLAAGEVTAFPPTNLPPRIASVMTGPFLLHSAEVTVGGWMEAGLPPLALRSAIGDDAVRFWSAKPPILRWDPSRAAEVYRHGTPHSRWKPADEPFPGWDAWWDPASGALFALSHTQPEGISVALIVHPEHEVAEYEPLHADPRTAPLRPGSLERTVEMGKISRRALFLPAPGCITLPLGRLAVDEARVVVGLVDRAYESADGGLRQSSRGSDGVRFALEISTRGRWKRIWQHMVDPSGTDAWHGPYSVNLRGYRGRKVTLRLVTEPGPLGDSSFDYAVWGDLRFVGETMQEPSRPHIILIDLDTLRRDRVGCHGASRDLTPRIDRWAAKSTVFTDCIAASSWTLPSTVSMFTGLAVHQHRVDRFTEVMTQDMAPVPLLLQRAGYETIGIAEGGYVASDFGFSLGFDLYDCTRFKDPRWHDVLDMVRRRRSQRPLFLFLHTYMVHAPYPYDGRFEDPACPYSSTLRGKDIEYHSVIEPHSRGILHLSDEDGRYIGDMYDALVSRTDEHVGVFIDSLLEALNGEPYALILTSDHGEEFLEHGLLGHAQSLFQELLAVPLIIQFPGQTRGRVEERPVSGLDLAPTILDLAGLSFEGLPGASLRALPPPSRRRIASQSRSVHALVSGGLKLISGRVASPRGLSTPVQLYDLIRDPLETVDLTMSGHDSTTVMAQRLVAFLKSTPPPVAEATGAPPPRSAPWTGDLRRLEALGYLRPDPSTPSAVRVENP